MKLRRLGIEFSTLGLALFALASCSDETTLNLSYQNLEGEVEEVSVSKSSNEVDVLNTLKVLTRAEGNYFNNVDKFTVKSNVNIKADYNGSNFEMKSKYDFFIDMENDCTCYFETDTYTDISDEVAIAMGESKGSKVDISNNIYIDKDYAYLCTSTHGNTLKYKTSSSQFFDQKMGLLDSLSEYSKEFINRRASPFFDSIDFDLSSYEDSYSAIVNNEEKILEEIKKKNVSVSSVTKDRICITLCLVGKNVKEAYNNFGTQSQMEAISSVADTDEMRLTFGYSTDTYFLSYIGMEMSMAPGLITSSFGVEFSNVESFFVEVEYLLNKGKMKLPSDKDSYTYIGV